MKLRNPGAAQWLRIVLAIGCIIGALLLAQRIDDVADAHDQRSDAAAR